MRVSSPWAYHNRQSPGKRDPYCHLAAGVLAQAVREARQRKNPDKRIDAVIWFIDPDSSCKLFCESLGLDYKRVISWAGRVDLKG